MSSTIESLAPELSDGLASYLSLSELSRLMRTSRGLHRRLEPLLYVSQAARNEALRWACTRGQLSAIGRVISTYGASPSTVRLTETDGPSPATLTLHLAVRKGHLDAFRLLLELGARVDNRDATTTQLESLLRRLFSPPKPDFVRAFFEAGCGSQLPSRLLDRTLVMLINKGASLDLVLLALDSGASPNRIQSRGGLRQCPMSACIFQTSKPLFDLLLKRGASIHGGEIEYPRRIPVHIPIYAAAYVMLKHGTAMMQACLDNGADINHRALMPRFHYRMHYHYGTPLLGYLDSIKTWPVDADCDPVHNLEYLFEKGAIADELPNVTLPDSNKEPIYHIEPLSSLEVLLDSMHGKFELLTDPQFLAVAKLLIQHDAAKGRVGLLLGKYDPPRCSESAKRGWRSFITLLLDAPDRNEHVSTLLSNYIDARGRSLEPLGDLTVETITVLVERGADINASGTDGHPPLQLLCWRYHVLERMHTIDDSHTTVHFGSRNIAEQRRRLVAFLLAKGANPDLKMEGKTAEEILVDGVGSHPEEGNVFIKGLVEEIWKSRASS